MKKFKFQVYILALIVTNLVSILKASEDSLFVLTPHLWLSQFDQTIYVDRLNTDFLSINGKLNINVVKSNDKKFNYSLDQNIDSNIKLFKFKLPADFPSGFYNLTVIATGKSNYLFKNFTTDIEYVKKIDGYYIITDKSIYKPSETVNFRIVGVDGLLNAINNRTVSVFILDPSSNLISQQKNLTLNSGLIDNLSFRLGSKASSGEWKIKIIVDNIEETQYFMVKEYVLPKFDFVLDAPIFLIRSDDSYDGTIEAKYNYGKYVEGEALINLINKNYYSYFEKSMIAPPSSSQEKLILSKSFKLSNEKLQFSLPISKDVFQNYYSLVLNVTITDGLSGEKSSKEVYISMYDNEFVTFLDTYEFEMEKLNNFTLTLKYHNEKPYALKDVKLKAYTYLNYQPISKNEIFSFKTNINGEIKFQYYIPRNTTSFNFEIESISDPGQKYSSYLYPKIITQTSDIDKLFTIELANKSETIKINSSVNVKINLYNKNDTCYNANYLIITRSFIESYGTFNICNEYRLFHNITRLNAPFTNLIVYAFNKKNNLYVENLELTASNVYSNYLNLNFDNDKVEPGKNVTLSIQSEPGSLVGLCIYDQSLDMIRTANDLKKDNIREQLNQQKLGPYFPQIIADIPIMFGRPNSVYQFYVKNLAELKLQQNGLILFHDLNSLRPVLTNNSNILFMINDGNPGANRPEASMSDQASKVPSSDSTERIRSDFRESWIWQVVKISENSQFNLTTVIPETITSWVATGFSLNSNSGLAIADKRNITTFQSFFVSMVLPKSLIRGEILILQVIVYNYLEVDLQNVTVSLSKTDDFRSVLLKNNGASNQLVNIKNDLERVIPIIKSQTGQTVTFLITPINIGYLPLTVKAKSAFAADAERKNILVKSEGVEDFNSIPLLIDLRDTKKYETNYQIVLPQNIVPNSQYCSVQVVGDIIGPAFNNLENLVTKPFGCGEQNMITLTPNIYALRYLLATSANKKSKINNLDNLVENSRNNILFGYQNQLNYLRNDGSFSAFGNNDQSGSTWLTAFVIRSFSQAKEYATIDENIIKNSTSWLIKQQNRDGSFREPGNVIHSNMQGGVNSKITITAYVIISLITSNLNDRATNNTIINGLKFLENSLSSKSLDIYALGLITYALNLGKSNQADLSFNRFDALANRKVSDQIYWATTQDSPTSSSRIPIYKSFNDVPSSDIETTSYGLLTYLLRKRRDSALLIAKWLISKSNSLGTYSSTQNTILALESLSQFGISLMLNRSTPLNVNINVKVTNTITNSSLNNTFIINEENSLLLQSWSINNCNSTNISIIANGNGIVSFKTIVNYNLPNVADNSSDISVSQILVTKDFKNKNILPIRTCARYTNKNKNVPKTGMFVVESEIFGGFDTNIDKTKIKNNLKLVEISQNNKVSFYFDNLNETLTCIDWQMTRTYPVSNLKPVTVAAYDYYNPLVQKRVIFNSPSDFSSSNICKTNANLRDCK